MRIIQRIQRKKENLKHDRGPEIYEISRTKRILFALESLGLVLILSYLFYESFLAAVPLLPISFFFYRNEKKQEVSRLKWKLNLQFQDALTGMTSALSAGYSVENSITEALVDLRCIYKENDLIIQQFQQIEKKIKLNATIEEAFFEFARLSRIDDVLNFAWILYTAKRTGGDLLKITRNTSSIISERIEVNREIQTIITGKQLESRIMSLVPAGIIVYLKVGCAGFLDSLYGNLPGVMVMSVVLVFYVLAYQLSNEIVKIQV